MPTFSIWRPWLAAPLLRHHALALWIATLGAWGSPAYANASPYVGEQMLFAGSYCPMGWLEANGQQLQISEYETLFVLVGTTYGGNGVDTFALPDLRGRTPIGQGTGPGLTMRTLGQATGQEQVVLQASQMPAHSHAVLASSTPATHATPGSNRRLASAQNAGAYAQNHAASTVALNTTTVAGGNQPIDVRNPFLAMKWCIAVDGIFPTRE